MSSLEQNKKEQFIHSVKETVSQNTFVKLTLSNPIKSKELKRFSAQSIELKDQSVLKCTYRYETQDKVKNLHLEEIDEEIVSLLNEHFKQGILIDQSKEQTLLISKKGKATLLSKVSKQNKVLDKSHDRKKNRLVELNEPFLHLLGVSDKNGNLIPKMADKYKQINKYLEIFQANISQIDTSKKLKVVDMGSGKGYLTFALYHYLTYTLNLEVDVIGVELREGLVNKCNTYAKECDFKNLHFLNKRIEDFKESEIDILIALHACDTATDDAIAAGIKADCELIVCAPCCHKQIRREIEKAKNSNSITKHGIFLERSCEMITDTMRALILENYNYKAKIFEFVSNEHTRKNIMLSAVKQNQQVNKDNRKEIEELKSQYGIQQHYLERLMGE